MTDDIILTRCLAFFLSVLCICHDSEWMFRFWENMVLM